MNKWNFALVLTCTYLSLSHASQGASDVPPLPGPFYFEGLPEGPQLEVFKNYIGDAPTISGLYERVNKWKKSNKIMLNKVVNSTLGKKAVLEKEAAIIKSIYNRLLTKGFAEQAASLNVYIHPEKNTSAQDIEQKSSETVARIKNLKIILSKTLAQVALASNNMTLIQLLILNGANVNYSPKGAKPTTGL